MIKDALDYLVFFAFVTAIGYYFSWYSSGVDSVLGI